MANEVTYRLKVSTHDGKIKDLRYTTAQDADVESAAERMVRAVKRVEQAQRVTVLDIDVE